MARESKGSGAEISNYSNFLDWLFENKEILNGSQDVRADCWRLATKIRNSTDQRHLITLDMNMMEDLGENYPKFSC